MTKAPRKIIWEGKEYTLGELARKCGIGRQTLANRLDSGTPLEEALNPPPPTRVLTSSSGETNTISGWARKLEKPIGTLRNRMYEGWTDDEVLEIVERRKPRQDEVLLTVGGETLNATEWSRRTGIHAETIRGRVRRGWTHEQALGMVPSPREISLAEYPGELLTKAEVARRLGISKQAMSQRIRRGWKPEDAFSLENVQWTSPSPKKRGRPKKLPLD